MIKGACIHPFFVSVSKANELEVGLIRMISCLKVLSKSKVIAILYLTDLCF